MGKKGAKVVTKLTFEDKIEGEILFCIERVRKLRKTFWEHEPTRDISDRIKWLKGKIYGLESALKIYNIPDEEEIALTKHLRGELDDK